MSELTNNLVAGAKGTYIVNDTTEATMEFVSIMVLDDTVFSSIKIDGADVKSTLISTPANTVKAGTLIRPKGYQKMSGVQLTSGSVSLILKG